MNTMNDALSVFVGVYLDEDLFDSYRDELEAADAFMTREPQLARSLSTEISHLLYDARDEMKLEARLVEMGMGIDTNGLTYREWLTRIADHVSRATSGG
jgi:hypothetical protein